MEILCAQIATLPLFSLPLSLFFLLSFSFFFVICAGRLAYGARQGGLERPTIEDVVHVVHEQLWRLCARGEQARHIVRGAGHTGPKSDEERHGAAGGACRRLRRLLAGDLKGGDHGRRGAARGKRRAEHGCRHPRQNLRHRERKKKERKKGEKSK